MVVLVVGSLPLHSYSHLPSCRSCCLVTRAWASRPSCYDSSQTALRSIARVLLGACRPCLPDSLWRSTAGLLLPNLVPTAHALPCSNFSASFMSKLITVEGKPIKFQIWDTVRAHQKRCMLTLRLTFLPLLCLRAVLLSSNRRLGKRSTTRSRPCTTAARRQLLSCTTSRR